MKAVLFRGVLLIIRASAMNTAEFMLKPRVKGVGLLEAEHGLLVLAHAGV